MRTQEPSVIRSLWQQVLLAQTGLGESMDACTEGFTWVKKDQGAITELEAMIPLSFRVVESAMSLVFVPADGGDERVVSLQDGEAIQLLEIVVQLGEYGVIPAPFSGGTRSDFIMLVDFAGDVYLLPPGTKLTANDRPLPEGQLFLAERLLNFIEVC